MIAIAPISRSCTPENIWHAGFLEQLPTIKREACFAFRHLDAEAREEAVTEAIAAATVAYARLVELNKTDFAYPSVLAQYAVRQVRSGRHVGGHINSRDVLSRHAQRYRGFAVEQLRKLSDDGTSWEQVVAQDTRCASPADIAAFRIDFKAWLAKLPRRIRQIALALAEGDRTGEVALRFRLSAGRVSQLRRELFDAWNAFHGEIAPCINSEADCRRSTHRF